MSASTIKQITEMPTEDLQDLIRKVDMIYHKMSDDDERLTVEEAALMLKRSVHTVRRVKALIGFKKEGNDIFFFKSDVKAYMMRDYTPPVENLNQTGLRGVART